MEGVLKILSNFYLANEMIQYNRRHFCQLYTGHYSGFCEFRKINCSIFCSLLNEGSFFLNFLYGFLSDNIFFNVF